ncbi:carboxylesterase family protein [Corynebacterium mendelii]|uniref:Carboxylic ester hydrolase n=1 Tax=Corynebacterium mendelii TaxID=2765362 RepID=A0A939IX89_9CORY|nr:carboxylesterase family protein [Corynebacterium mendelii]MBN9644225.1 carboxylesterase/lipase family protein [Corynebacterium mendelii]
MALSRDRTVTVTCPDGTFTGTIDDARYVFYCIPYATVTDPFLPSTRPQPTAEPVDCTTPMAREVALTVSTPEGSLDRERDPQHPPRDLPVIVWVHGGNYSVGHPDRHPGQRTSFNRDDAVFVGVGYRKKFAGFATFDDDEPDHYRGIDDVALALEWVATNIESFGGDPTNVTLVGQSAGGGIVLWLARKDHYTGLFRRVLALSPGFPRQSFQQRSATIARLGRTGLTRADFQSMPKKKLDTLFSRVHRRYFTDATVGPAVFSATDLADVPIWVSQVHDEFVNDPAAVRLDRLKLGALSVDLCKNILGITGSIDDYLDYCRGIDPAHISGRAAGDAVISQWVDDVATNAPGPTWLSQVVPGTTADGAPLAAYHCCDLGLVFPDFAHSRRISELVGNQPERLAGVARWWHGKLIDFARGQQPDWPEYTRDDRRALSIPLTGPVSAIGPVTDPLRQVRAAFNSGKPRTTTG